MGTGVLGGEKEKLFSDPLVCAQRVVPLGCYREADPPKYRRDADPLIYIHEADPLHCMCEADPTSLHQGGRKTPAWATCSLREKASGRLFPTSLPTLERA